MKRAIAALSLAVVSIAPAHGQTIVDTFHQLRSTLKQLGTKPAPPNGASGQPVAPINSPVVDSTADGLMVPTSVVADDTSDSALETTPLVAHRIMSFDVRGLKLGMSPREVGRVTDRQHFKRRWNSIFFTSGTFEVEAARVANSQLNRPVEKTSIIQLKQVQGFDPAGDGLKLEFTIEPSGPKLSRIEYTAKLNGMTKAQTFEALARKYGPPNGNSDPIVASWGGGPGAAGQASPSLYAAVDGGNVMLTLQQSINYVQGARKRLDDRAQQIAAANGGGVKF